MDVMLAKQGNIEDLKSKNFIFEPKFDGTRVLIYKKDREIRLINRRHRDITYRYPELKEIWKNIKEDSIIDGELIVLDKNHRPSFNLLQKREQIENKTEIELRSRSFPATIFVFDVLGSGNKKLINLPFSERKKILKKQIKPSSRIILTPYTRDGNALWKKIKKIRMEGVMAKRIDSRYLSGKRTNAWLKIKNLKTLDAIVIGYTQEKREISALVLAAYHNKKLIYIGRVASGLNEKIISELSKKFEKADKPAVKVETHKKVYYVKPKVIIEVKFLQITKNFQLRVPVFLRVRIDKNLKECLI